MQKSYWRDFTKHLGAKLGVKLKMLSFTELAECRFVDILHNDNIVRLYMAWDRDGSSTKPVTEMWTGVEATQVGERYAVFSEDYNVGRMAIWNQPEQYADNWAKMLRRESRDEGFMPFGVLTPSATDEDEDDF